MNNLYIKISCICLVILFIVISITTVFNSKKNKEHFSGHEPRYFGKLPLNYTFGDWRKKPQGIDDKYPGIKQMIGEKEQYVESVEDCRQQCIKDDKCKAISYFQTDPEQPSCILSKNNTNNGVKQDHGAFDNVYSYDKIPTSYQEITKNKDKSFTDVTDSNGNDVQIDTDTTIGYELLKTLNFVGISETDYPKKIVRYLSEICDNTPGCISFAYVDDHTSQKYRYQLSNSVSSSISQLQPDQGFKIYDKIITFQTENSTGNNQLPRKQDIIDIKYNINDIKCKNECINDINCKSITYVPKYNKPSGTKPYSYIDTKLNKCALSKVKSDVMTDTNTTTYRNTFDKHTFDYIYDNSSSSSTTYVKSGSGVSSTVSDLTPDNCREECSRDNTCKSYTVDTTSPKYCYKDTTSASPGDITFKENDKAVFQYTYYGKDKMAPFAKPTPDHKHAKLDVGSSKVHEGYSLMSLADKTSVVGNSDKTLDGCRKECNKYTECKGFQHNPNILTNGSDPTTANTGVCNLLKDKGTTETLEKVKPYNGIIDSTTTNENIERDLEDSSRGSGSYKSLPSILSKSKDWNIRKCEEACLEDPNCNSYLYKVDETIENKKCQYKCYLYNTYAKHSTNPNPDYSTGKILNKKKKFIHGYSFKDKYFIKDKQGDYKGNSQKTLANCALECLKDPTCQSIEFENCVYPNKPCKLSTVQPVDSNSNKLNKDNFETDKDGLVYNPSKKIYGKTLLKELSKKDGNYSIYLKQTETKRGVEGSRSPAMTGTQSNYNTFEKCHAQCGLSTDSDCNASTFFTNGLSSCTHIKSDDRSKVLKGAASDKPLNDEVASSKIKGGFKNYGDGKIGGADEKLTFGKSSTNFYKLQMINKDIISPFKSPNVASIQECIKACNTEDKCKSFSYNADNTCKLSYIPSTSSEFKTFNKYQTHIYDKASIRDYSDIIDRLMKDKMVMGDIGGNIKRDYQAQIYEALHKVPEGERDTILTAFKKSDDLKGIVDNITDKYSKMGDKYKELSREYATKKKNIEAKMVQNYDKVESMTKFNVDNLKLKNKLKQFTNIFNKIKDESPSSDLYLRNRQGKTELSLVKIPNDDLQFNSNEKDIYFVSLSNSNKDLKYTNAKCLEVKEKGTPEKSICEVKKIKQHFLIFDVKNNEEYNKLIKLSGNYQAEHLIDIMDKSIKYPLKIVSTYFNPGYAVVIKGYDLFLLPIRNDIQQQFDKVFGMGTQC